MKLRIKSRPDGGAPEEIRDKWIGAEIPVDETLLHVYEEYDKSDLPNTDAIAGGAVPQGAKPVFFEDAMAALRSKGENEAADWWEQHFGHLEFLAFDAGCCELVE